MPRVPFRSLPASGPARHGATFEERLYDSLRATPWWAASLVAHGAMALLLAVLVRPDPAAAAPPATVVMDVPEPPPEIDPEVLPPPVLPQTPDEERPREVPVELPREAKTESEADTDADVESEFLAPDSVADAPFSGPGVNGDVGIGPGAGGGLGSRTGSRRKLAGDGAGTGGAVAAGLEWLARHQSPAGHWDADGFEALCTGTKCGGTGGPLHDVGVSGLALLAFLAEGETHRDGRYAATVRGGLRWLKGVQDAEGCFGARTDGHFTYSHAIAAMAMAEAYGLTASPLFKTSAQAGVDFVHRCRNPYAAWRYGVRPGDNDSSVTGWMVMALKSAQVAGLRVDPAAFRDATAFLDRVTDPEYGRTGYTMRGNGPARPVDLQDRFPQDRSESLTAVGVLTRIFAGAAPDDRRVRQGVEVMARCLPRHDPAAGTVDHYYWYYGTLAMFQVGGDPWKRWNDAIKKALVDTQRTERDGHRRGSWDPDDPWGPEGGRVYSTAVNTMSLQVYYRYGRLFGMR